jgi:hypothetical protein
MQYFSKADNIAAAKYFVNNCMRLKANATASGNFAFLML